MELQSDQTILNNKYRIERLLGRGAFGEVYLATHRLLNAPVAIKVLRHDAPGVGSAEFGRFRERFLQEAQLGKRLNHPNVVRVDDFIEDAGGLYAGDGIRCRAGAWPTDWPTAGKPDS